MSGFFDRLLSAFGVVRCQHEWRDAYDFVSCGTLTYSMDPNSPPTMRPVAYQTMQWCPRCDEVRRKPNSARRALDNGNDPDPHVLSGRG